MNDWRARETYGKIVERKNNMLRSVREAIRRARKSGKKKKKKVTIFAVHVVLIYIGKIWRSTAPFDSAHPVACARASRIAAESTHARIYVFD